MKLSVLIPVYNEEMAIGELIERVARVNLGGFEMEIIVANDGSTDASAHIIEEHRQAHSNLIGRTRCRSIWTKARRFDWDSITRRMM